MTDKLEKLKEVARSDLKQAKGQIVSILPEGIDPHQFMKTVSYVVTTSEQSERLMSADRRSLLNACIMAAADGLMPDGRQAALVVIKGRVSYFPMVQGLVDMARNSGRVKSVSAEVVHERDGFQYRPGEDRRPRHSPQWFGDRGGPVGAYAVVTSVDGECHVSVMSERRILSIAAQGNNAAQYDPQGGKYYEEWWKKTVIKNALKYAPRSSSLDAVIQSDNDSQGFDMGTGNPSERLKERLSDRVTVPTGSPSPVGRGGADRYIKTRQKTLQIDADDADREVFSTALEAVDSCGDLPALEEAVTQFRPLLHESMTADFDEVTDAKRRQIETLTAGQ
ncbi:hypothetical protein CI610_00330 [invertebrate metagenome]|uniref:Uncharacterized protein n=1 Tax=invertebrate metagenome TaxID=1711999 RepID=A0A2H9TBV4_9ZZZZ